MLISYKWLQTYFEEKLPEAEKIAELLNFHAFEVEGIKAWDTDEILDVKVLADRACYALSHRGVAGEIAATLNLKLKRGVNKENVGGVLLTPRFNKILKIPEIEIKKPALCARYIGWRVEGVEIGKSPDWLVERLESIGERSVNNIVDAANFVMFDIGEPLHSFDADKVKGAIQIRLAKKGEKITTLDNREVELNPAVLIIADDEGPLAIAGIKGGKRAEVTEKTENLILEAANFDRSSIRLASTFLELKTGAARRFEAGLSPELALEAMERFSALIAELCPNIKFGPVNDVYKHKQKPAKIEITNEFIGSTLGVNIPEEKIIEILNKLNITAVKKGLPAATGAAQAGDRLIVTPPLIRTDLKIPEDIVEEVGRIYGYENVAAKLPPAIKGRAAIDKNFYYIEKIRNILLEQGFNEVSLYTLVSKGHFEAAKPSSPDRKFLRENLADGVAECLKRNVQNAPLLGLSEIRIFEVGRVFGPRGERTHVCVGRHTLIKKDRRNEDILREIVNLLGSAFGMPFAAKISTGPEGAIAELNITDLFRTARSPDSYDELGFGKASENKFKPFSPYPFALRDIAVWTPKDVDKSEPLHIIKKEAGEWLQRTDLFDTFPKDGKISYAYHLVFQSMQKTLTDGEVNEVMERITREMNGREGWQVR